MSDRHVEVANIINQQIFTITKMRIGWKIPATKYPVFAIPPHPDKGGFGGLQARITVKPRIRHYLVVRLNPKDLYDVSVKTVNIRTSHDPVDTVAEEEDIHVEDLNDSIMRCFNAACQAAGVHV
jgi:hypothetical protein